MYVTGELTSAINRIIEDINHRFVLSVLTRDFVSHGLGLSVAFMDMLDIRNREEQSVGINEAHVAEIKEYLQPWI